VAICGAAGIMMAVVTFGISPHYPWYFAWLAVPCVLAPNPAVLWLATAPVLIYLDTYGDRFTWPSVVFAPAVFLALAGAFRPVAEPIKGIP
jgi:alpha-1,6-mannosyltransferase